MFDHVGLPHTPVFARQRPVCGRSSWTGWASCGRILEQDSLTDMACVSKEAPRERDGRPFAWNSGVGGENCDPLPAVDAAKTEPDAPPGV